jgi:hypothetical protein
MYSTIAKVLFSNKSRSTSARSMLLVLQSRHITWHRYHSYQYVYWIVVCFLFATLTMVRASFHIPHPLLRFQHHSRFIYNVQNDDCGACTNVCSIAPNSDCSHSAKQSNTKNKCCMALTMNSDNENEIGAAKVARFYGKRDVVWYDLSCIYGQMEQPSKVRVKLGDDIDTIKKRIKKQNRILFRNFDAHKLKLYQSVESTEPLDAWSKWKTSLIWGVKDTPLIVREDKADHYITGML